MGFAEDVKIRIDVAADNAVASLKNFKTSIGEAEGFTGKLKAGVGGLGDMFKSAAANPAVMGSAIAAVGGFALKAVGDFSELGQEVGKFSEATGLSAEESSRWIETAGDMGISSDTLRSAIGKMEKALGANKDAFKEFGIQAKYAADGTVDANATFLAAVDAINAIKDPTDKATAANKIFGKGWAEMAELVGQGATKLQESLDSVETGKVLDEADVAKARAYRDAMDALSGVVQDLTLKLGKALIPTVTKLAGVLQDLAAPITWLSEHDPLAWATGGKIDAISGVTDALLLMTNPIIGAKTAFDDLSFSFVGSGTTAGIAKDATKALDAMFKQNVESAVALAGAVDQTTTAEDEQAAAARTAKTAQDDLKAAMDRGKASSDALKASWDALTGSIDADQAWLDLQTTIDTTGQAAKDAYTAFASGAADSEQKARDAASATNTLKDAVITYGREVLGLPPERVTRLTALIDEGQMAEFERRMAILTRNRNVSVQIIAKGGAGFDGGLTGARAQGGPVSAGGTYVVGEEGPEVVTFGASGNVTPNDALGGVTNNITINMPPGADGKDVVRAIKQYERTAGPGWRA